MYKDSSISGLFSALGAYLIWGFSVIFFKQLKAVPPFEILMHRMIWSFVLLMALVVILQRRRKLGRVLTSLRTLRVLLVSTLLVSCNWGLYILNLSTIGILQYLAPSCTFLLAVFFYHEPFASAQLYCFCAIWLALVLYSYDAVHYAQRMERL